MAIVVEHEKRKREILEKSFQLFIEDGYEDVTYQKIADKCGITRTTLYIYFKNKREIFLWSIKQLTNDVEQELIEIIKNTQIDSIECLKRIFLCFKNVTYAARKKRCVYKRPGNKARYPNSAFDEYGFNPWTKKSRNKKSSDKRNKQLALLPFGNFNFPAWNS